MKDKEGKNYNDAYSWDEKNFDVGGKEGAEWGDDGRDDSDNDDEDRKEEEEEGKGDGYQM